MQLTPGLRLRSAVGATEIVVVRPPQSGDAVLSCGGVPMRAHQDESAPDAGGVRPDHEGATLLGKRYGLDDDPVEVLVTKAGDGALSLDGRPLQVKEPKPLPSSD